MRETDVAMPRPFPCSQRKQRAVILRQHAIELPDGRTAMVVELGSGDSFRVLVASLGATLLRIDAPDRNGRLDNVLLGSDDIHRYPSAGAPGPESYMGATCG